MLQCWSNPLPVFPGREFLFEKAKRVSSIPGCLGSSSRAPFKIPICTVARLGCRIQLIYPKGLP